MTNRKSFREKYDDKMRDEVARFIQQQAADHEEIARDTRALLSTVKQISPHIAREFLEVCKHCPASLIRQAIADVHWADDAEEWSLDLITACHSDPVYRRQVEQVKAYEKVERGYQDIRVIRDLVDEHYELKDHLIPETRKLIEQAASDALQAERDKQTDAQASEQPSIRRGRLARLGRRSISK